MAGGTHPYHIHLVPHQLISRRPLNRSAYATAWFALNGGPPVPAYSRTPTSLDPTPYYTGPVELPAPHERAWIDVVQAYGSYVTTIRLSMQPTIPGTFPFDALGGPGYVQHCHIIDHEDSEMMIRMVARSQNCQPEAYNE